MLRRSRVAILIILWASTVAAAPAPAERVPPSLQVVTYNLRSGLGPGLARRAPAGAVRRNLESIADAIVAAPATGEPPVDLVALNEVDFGSRRSGWIDQASFLAASLERRTGRHYAVVRGETWRRGWPGFEVRFGNAALVRHPVVDSVVCGVFDPGPCGKAAPPGLPDPMLRRFLEPRGVVRVTFDSPLGRVDAVVTHLDPYFAGVREAQAARVLARFLDLERTTLVLGDMNAIADDATHAILVGAGLRDARLEVSGPGAPWATFPARAPERAIDWVLASPDLAARDLAVIGEDASDHRGLFVRYGRRSP